jgi:RNA polymerase sigma-70 factor (ECF subfamily)
MSSGQDALQQMFVAGQTRWPRLQLGYDAFRSYCTRVLDASDSVPVDPADIYLCCACAEAEPEAIRSFEDEGRSVAEAAIRRIDSSDDFVHETLQELWTRLLVGSDAKVRSFSGRGPLKAWVRVTATRIALDRLRVKKRGQLRHVELSDELAGETTNIEVSLLKARYGEAFQQALRTAVAALSVQDRNVLRMHVVGRCSIDEIGCAYNVHRATAARWIERARARIHDEVRDELCVRHKLTQSEFHSLAGVLGAELSLTLSVPSRPPPPSGRTERGDEGA